MKKFVTSTVADLWLMDLLKFELFDKYFLLILQGIAIFRASFNDYFCYFQVSFTYIHTYIQTDRQTDRQAGRQTDRQKDRQTDRQTDRVHLDS